MTTLRLDTPTLLELYEPRWAPDPYPFYRMLRERHPVYYDELLGSWVVSRYEDIVALSRHAGLSEDRVTGFAGRLAPDKRAAISPLTEALSAMMLFNDAPRHGELRALAKEGFTRSATARLRPVIERIVDDLLDAVVADGRIDLIGQFSEPLSQRVIAQLLGIAEGDRWLLADWASLLDEFFTQSTAQIQRLRRLRSMYEVMAVSRRACPRADLTSMIVSRAGEGTDRFDDIAFANVLLVIDAGQVTTTYLIGNAIRALLARPDQLDLLRNEPERIGTAVHEFMRFDNSVQFTSRTVVGDLELDGQHPRQGDTITLLLGSGNHDEAEFVDPDVLDITRDARRHLSFGHGAHYCLGAPLGLLEIEVAVTRLLERLPNLRLAGPALQWKPTINFRFLEHLPLSFTAGEH